MSTQRQTIITALERAGHPMSVSQIMAAVERTDRNAVDCLLYKMRKAGDIAVAGRGLYTLAGQDPISGGGQISQIDVSPDQSVSDQSVQDDPNKVADSPADRLKESPAQPWAISDADAARHAERYRAARKEKGELIATRVLRWELQDAGVLYDRLQREVDRIRQLAETCYIEG
jgi:hypothetical protein